MTVPGHFWMLHRSLEECLPLPGKIEVTQLTVLG